MYKMIMHYADESKRTEVNITGEEVLDILEAILETENEPVKIEIILN